MEWAPYVLTPAALLVAGSGYTLGWWAAQAALAWGLGVVTAVCTLLLVRRALAIHSTAGSFGPCRGVGFLGMGVLAGGLSLILGAARGPEGAYVVSAGAAVSASVFILGLMLLPGAAPALRSRVRRLLDGAAIGLCLFFAGWTLVVSPLTSRAGGVSGGGATTAIVLVMALSATLAVTALTAVGAVRHRPAAMLCAIGVAVALMEHSIVALSLLVNVGWPLLLASVAAWSAGPLLIWAGARRSAQQAVEPSRGHHGVPTGALANLPLLSVSAALGLLGAIYHLAAYGGFGQYTALIAVSAACAVAVRGGFASLDLSRYARRLAEQENRFATTDPLTGLPNRLRLRHRLERERDKVHVGARCGTLLAIDVDNFGELDDVQGHDVGDAVLMEVARRLRVGTSAPDLATRLAGDSFAVLTTASPSQAEELAARLLRALAEPYRPVGVEPGAAHLTVSIGLAECNAAASVDEMIRAAELAVASAKERGGNRIERYDEKLQVRTLRRQTYAHDLRGAVDGGELDLLYQPVVALADGTPVGLQAGLRWLHPVLGAVPHAELLAAAGDTGLVNDLGDWALRAACRQLSRWINEGRDLWVAVTVSPIQLRAPGFVEGLRELLRSRQVPPQRLVLELSERQMAAHNVTEQLAAAQQLGVRTALAEFGSGLCPLVELRRLPVDVLRTDASLTAALVDSGPIAELVVSIGNRLGSQVIADGVAEHWQAEVLAGAGCRWAMGELFSRPVPAEHAEAYLDTHANGSPHLRP